MSTRNRTPASATLKSSYPATSKAPSKFELPALSVGGFGSLTDGTDIPPPERELTPPPPSIDPASVPLPGSSAASQVNGNGVGNGRKPSQISIAGTNDTRPGTPNGEGMLSPVMSPTSPNRPPSSMKRFLSRKSMNGDYNSGGGERNGSTDHTNSHSSPAHPPSRPESSLSFVSQGGTKTKKKRSWWQKLMGKEEKEEVNIGKGPGGANGNGTPMARKRTSTVMEKDEPKEARQPPAKKGPPPPTLPQLRGVSREGKADGSFGGDDMFSNIR